MADNQLTATSGSGTQDSTQSPQASVQSGNVTASSSSVQPGTATSLLNGGSGGVALQPTPLSTVSLGSTAAQTQATSQTTPTLPGGRHINPALFGFSVALCLIAVGLFWLAARSEKNTTDYS